MKRYTNIEELKNLIPDYITGQISDSDKLMLENAMSESAELKELYNEMTGTLAFVNNIKFSEPSPQYFSTLLPRIHERIQQQEENKFSWANIPAVWKMLVPIAAVVVIAVVYYLVKPGEVQVTKDDKKIENIKKDSNNNNNQNNNNDNKNSQLPQDNKENIVKETHENEKQNKTEHKKHFKPDNIVKHEAPDTNHTDNEDLKDDYTTVDDESSPFSNGEGAGFDYENELDDLTDTEQNTLLKQLEKSNL
jgi:hypothetical protein